MECAYYFGFCRKRQSWVLSGMALAAGWPDEKPESQCLEPVARRGLKWSVLIRGSALPSVGNRLPADGKAGLRMRRMTQQL